MFDTFNKWYKRYLFEEEAILLLVMLVISVTLVVTIGDILAPLLAAMVLAFLMQGLSSKLQGYGLPKWVGVSVSFLVFVGAFFGVTLGLLPLAWRQFLSLASELPAMLGKGQQLLAVLPEQYPELFSEQQMSDFVSMAQAEAATLGQFVVTQGLAGISGLFAFMVYMILIPILVFFFLRDRELILNWLGGFLPEERPLLTRIWTEMNLQFANYARGKVIEIIVVGAVSYASFSWMGLNYAALLALLVGLSVIIPYIGAVIVTLPVVLVGFFQWGFAGEFYTLCVVYIVIQALDGNVLVPFLFSEAVNLHPVAIILAILFFGGIWGMWGVFFAIPLATLIKAIIYAWPSGEGDPMELPAPDIETAVE
ncbi:AI-2E family transporter [Halioglobus japonicus]|uniref:AI-2E family transporter n=1 Tax=Halioglobus japonicus TaxID=930805 RepID=A0AAP8SN54_9GAMM|nr:AI-2E family transporter [Halioglobus japonicus]PLW86267.1 AI-2E family transporter [Halioglobus japonicus]GHD13650.1 AI-2E family transporter [Halioglobus japonicus]